MKRSTAEAVTAAALIVADKSRDIEKWIKAASLQMEKITKQKEERLAFMQQTLIFTKGKKYYRLVVQRKDDGGQPSAYAFIDMEGNIYKPAGWSSPAKGPRGHVDTTDVRKIDSGGGWLYKRGGGY